MSLLLGRSGKKTTTDQSISAASSKRTFKRSKWMKNKKRNKRKLQARAQKKLVAREYQVSCCEQAKDKNIIVVLNTGMGKTLISVLLIKHMAAAERERRAQGGKPRVTFFICHHKPLVYQQEQVIQANCDLSVKSVTGIEKMTARSEEEYKKYFEAHDVVVCTAQILLDNLRRGFTKMHKVNLLIFDEAHHARKDDPYALIMRHHYHTCEENLRPKVFGMTASPVEGRGDIAASISNLESILNAEVVVPPAEAYAQHTTHIDQEQLLYSRNDNLEPTKLTNIVDQIVNGAEELKDARARAAKALEELGPWACDRSWTYFANEVEQREGGRLEPHQYALKSPELQPYYEALHEIRLHPLPELNIDSRFLGRRNSSKGYFCADKACKLLKYLQGMKNQSHFRGIVFVQQRHIAHMLGLMIKECKGLEFIKPGVLVGHGTNEDGDSAQRSMYQTRTIKDFREGEINLLVSTNVGEEGLDIQPCNVVIRFDLFSSVLGFIQSRGRARRKDSKYVIMCEEGKYEHQKMIERVNWEEHLLKQFCIDRAGAKSGQADDEDDDEDFATAMNDILKSETCYVEPVTGARLTPEGSIALIHEYCQSLPVDAYTVAIPEFTIVPAGNNYACNLRLPAAACIQSIEYDQGCTSRNRAKRMAAFTACMELRKRGALNEHHLPDISWKLDQQFKDYEEGNKHKDEDGYIAGIRKTRRRYKVKKPFFFHWQVEDSKESLDSTIGGNDDDSKFPVDVSPLLQERADLVHSKQIVTKCNSVKSSTEEWHVSEILIDMTATDNDPMQFRTLLFLTKESLPHVPIFNLYFQTTAAPVNFRPAGTLSLDRKQIDDLSKYTLRLIGTITNKRFRCKEEFPYLLAPLSRRQQSLNGQPIHMNDLPWQEIAEGAHLDILPLNIAAVERDNDFMIVDKGDSNRRYFAKYVRHDLNPLSNPGSSREKDYRNIAEYYSAQFKSLTCSDMTQPLLEVTAIIRCLNYLTPHGVVLPARRGRIADFVIPEFCVAHSLPASVFRTAMLLPSITTQLDSILICHDLNFRLSTNIDIKPLMEALTTPSAGMDTHYQRLEFLGDAVLKLLTTVYLFVIHRERHEGELNAKRARIINNRDLYKHARSLGIPTFAKSHPFQRTAWRPPHYTIEKETEQEGTKFREVQSQELSDKTAADLVEAILGAAYITGGIVNALTAAKALKIPLDGINRWSDLPKLPKIHELDPKLIQQINVSAIEAMLGYTFKDKMGLAEGLTHTSALSQEAGCYQRVEFLGDALLDWFVVKYLYFKLGTTATPGQLTEAKGAMVSNVFLSALCDRLGLQKHLLHCSPKLPVSMAAYSKELQDVITVAEIELPPHLAVDAADAKTYPPTGEYWIDCNVEAPKVMADMVEAILGAVFVDSGYDIAAAEEVFNRLVLPMIQSSGMRPGHVRIHPVTKLMLTVQQKGCDETKIVNQKDFPGMSIHSYEQAQLLANREGITGFPEQRMEEEKNEEDQEVGEDGEEGEEALDDEDDYDGHEEDSDGDDSEEEEPIQDHPDADIYGKTFAGDPRAAKHSRDNRYVTVVVHGKPIAVGAGESGRISRKDASEKAIKVIEDEEWFQGICDCRAKRELMRNQVIADEEEMQDEPWILDPLGSASD